MRIRRLKLKAFRGYFDEQVFNFSPGVILLSGNNGYGKTSLFDAIEWVITGKISRYEGTEEKRESEYITNIFAHRAGKYAEVEIELTSEAESIQIIRQADNPSRPRIYYNQDYLGDTNETIFDNITNRDQLDDSYNFIELCRLFTQSILLSQEQISEFIRTEKPPQRFSSLSKMLGMKEFENFADLFSNTARRIAERKAPFERKIEGISLDLDKKYSELDIENKKKHMDVQVEDEDQFILNKMQEISSYFGSISGLNVEFDKTLKGIELFENTDGALKKIQYLLNNKSVVTKERYEKIQQIKDLLEKYGSAKNKQSKIVRQIENKEKRISVLRKHIAATQKNNLVLLNESNNVKNQQKKMLSELDAIHVLQGNRDKVIMALEKQMQKNKRLDNLSLSYKQIKSKFRIQKKSINDQEKNLREISRIVEELEKNKREYDLILVKSKKYITDTNCPTCGYKWESKNALIKAIESKLHTDSGPIQTKYKQRQKLLRKLSREKEQFEGTKYQLESLESERSSLVAEIQNLETSIKEFSYQVEAQLGIKRLGDIDKKLENRSKKIKTKLSQLDCINKTILSRMGKNESEKNKNNFKLDGLLSSLSEIRNLEKENSSLINKTEVIAKDVDVAIDKVTINKIESTDKQLLESIVSLRQKLEAFQADLAVLQSRRKKLELISAIEQLRKSKGEEEENLKIISQSYQICQKISNEAQIALEEINQEKVKNYLPYINQLYSRICPHPFFKTIDFKFDRSSKESPALYIKALDIRNEEIASNTALTFSQSQLNVLALCIFLTLNRIQNWCKLNAIMLDDPIQSMDQINVLRFIDVIRTLKESKQIIVSTQDMNIAVLLNRKLGVEEGEKFQNYQFKGYSRSGPIIELSS